MSIVAVDRVPLRTRRRAGVERIALDLALTHGYEAVTVEMICDAAMVSTSTFFNYFGSKEHAVLGPAPDPLDPARLEPFAHGTDDPLVELMSVLVADWPDDPETREVLLRRLDLIERTPVLRAAHHFRLEAASAQVERAALVRLRRDGADDSEDRARMVVAVSHALMHWMIDRLRSEPVTPWNELVERAVATLRSVA
jgi:AcrR family transcriptional regulator